MGVARVPGCPGGTCDVSARPVLARTSGVLPGGMTAGEWATLDAPQRNAYVASALRQSEREALAQGQTAAAAEATARQRVQSEMLAAGLTGATAGVRGIIDLITSENVRAEAAAQRLQDREIANRRLDAQAEQAALDRASNERIAALRGTTQGLTTTPAATTAGISTNTLLLVGGAGLVAFLLLRKKGRR